MRRTTRRSPIPVLEEPDQPLVRQPIEEAAHVQIQHPVHMSLIESTPQRIQRLMLAAFWPEPVREAEEVRLVDVVEHLQTRSLDELSSSAVTPSGRCRPSALGMYTLRTGLARYAPRFSLWESSGDYPQ